MKLAAEFNIDKDIFPPAGLYSSSEGFGVLASDIVLILTSIAAAIAIIFIIISGFKYLTSSGDEKKLASASGTLTYSIIGLVVVILAFIIIRAVQFFIGSDVLNNGGGGSGGVSSPTNLNRTTSCIPFGADAVPKIIFSWIPNGNLRFLQVSPDSSFGEFNIFNTNLALNQSNFDWNFLTPLNWGDADVAPQEGETYYWRLAYGNSMPYNHILGTSVTAATCPTP